MSYVDKFTPVQIGNYIFSGYLKQLRSDGKLSLIVPILLYHGADKWEYQTLTALFKELEPEWKKFLPDFDYIYNNLGELSDEEITSVDNRFLRACLLTMKYSSDGKWLAAHLLELMKLTDGASRNLIKGFFMYLFQQSKIGKAKIIEVMEALPPDTDDTVMSFADYFEEKGIEKGMEKGMEKGREEGLSEKNRKATINMIRKGYSDAEICEVQEVTPEYVSGIREELRH